jgi:hypothetical protein
MKIGKGTAYALAVGLGLLAAVVDFLSASGDEAPRLQLLLLAAGGGIPALLLPDRPWRWAAAAAVWLPGAHLLAYGLGLNDPLDPNTLLTRLLLIPVSLAAALIGAYAGFLIRTLGKRSP